MTGDGIPFATDEQLAGRLRAVQADLRALADESLDGLLAVRVRALIDDLRYVATVLDPEGAA
ncbi:MAG: hypothetical protein ACRDLV_05425 [Solirubrobacteraceae bacterium]